MKNILFILVFCAAFLANTNVKAQFVADFEFYLYITDAMGNRDSVLVGYANNTNISYNDYGTDYGTNVFNDTLEIRAVDWGWIPNAYNRSWKKAYSYWDCSLAPQRSSPISLAFSAMYPPIDISWDMSLFADNCRDNSIITTNEMQLQHPHFDDALHVTMSGQSNMIITLDTSDLYSYPATVYPNQTMQSGAVDSLYFVFMTFANDSLTINVNKTETTGIKIYPTISSSFINISIDNPMQPEVLIYNLQGQVLQRKENEMQQLDISALAAGVYIVEVRNGKDRLMQRVVKI